MSSRIVASIRRNAIAWLALFVALTGTSMAASHYVITNTKQIKPSVLKKLKGNHGAAGAKGPVGPQGAVGATGQQGTPGTGTPGKTGATGPSGPKGTTGEPGPSGGATGATGPTGEKGEKGTAGATGATGEKGEPGSGGGAKVFAHISASGAVEDSEGFGSVKVKADPKSPKTGKPELGVYCIQGLSPAPKNVQATLDGEEAQFALAPLVHLGQTNESGCSAETQITIETFEVELEPTKEEVIEEPANMGFFLLIN